MQNNLKSLRKATGTKVSAVLEELGISKNTYYGYEKGNPIPSDKLVLLSQMLKFSTDELLGIKK